MHRGAPVVLRGAHLLVAAAALALCAPGCSREAGVRPRRLELALKTSPARIDPARVTGVSGGEICASIYEGLVRFDARGRLVPALARRWSVDDGGRIYTFHLDSRARFSDGRRVTSRDVVYSFNRVLAPETASPRRWVLDRIRGAESATLAAPAPGVRAPDDSTVVIELARPFTPFLSLLAMPAAMVVPEGTAGAPAGASDRSGPPGSGPWQLEEWKRGDYILLSVNPQSPRRATGIDEVRYRIIPESFTRVAEFESGSLDVLAIPPAEVGRFRDLRGGIRREDRDELRVMYIGLNNRRGPFRDVRVRRALNMAVDVDRLIAVLEQGQGARARGAIPPALSGYRDRPAYPYDPKAARELLDRAGFPDGFEMQIWQRDSPEGNRLLEAVQGYLAVVGVRVTLVRREWGAFREAVAAGRVDAFFLDWFADYPDAENFLYPLFHSDNTGGGGNRAFFHDAAVDALIDRAAATVEPAGRASLYARADSLVYDRAPWIFLFFPRRAWAIAPRVAGFEVPVLYTGIDFSHVSLDSAGGG